MQSSVCSVIIVVSSAVARFDKFQPPITLFPASGRYDLVVLAKTVAGVATPLPRPALAHLSHLAPGNVEIIFSLSF